MRAVGIAILAVVTTGLSAGACAQPAPRARSVEEAIQRLDASLSEMRYVNPADLLGDRGSAAYRASQSLILQKQCDSGSANPLLMVSHPVRVTLKARLDGGDVRVDGEAMEIALHVATVTDLPAEYLKETSALLNAAGADVATVMRSQAWRDYQVLKGRVGQLVASYDSAACRRGIAARDTLIFMPPSF